MTVVHLTCDVLLGDVRPTVLDADARVQVVEVATIQLKELYQHDAQINVGVCGVFTWIQLKQQ